ncbi:MAG TPA: ACT domain-containing protein [Thauera sp.]|nr:ACT domain-containing protein [Thauera sp.]HRA81400.1 ACT domain-containing protein [Thauera sp.]
MMTSVVLTLIGPDRPGLVSAVAGRAAAVGASWMESRLAQLAGKFAGVVRLEVDSARLGELEALLRGLEAEGLRVAIEHGAPVPAAVTHRARLELVGHDRPGIVRDISAVLARHGVSIDALETSCESASMSGEPLFRACAELELPSALQLDVVREDLEALANELMVDLDLTDAGGAVRAG